jgi:hypothetical protein
MGLHLWYLEMPFVFSLLTFPAFLWLGRESTRPTNERIADLLARSYLVFLIAVPLALMEVWVRQYPADIYYSLNAFVYWFWILGLMGFAAAHLTTTNRFLKYANEAVLPFYILQ